MKYQVGVTVHLDLQLNALEAENEEEAKSIAYDRAKELLMQSKIKEPLRPFTIRVAFIGPDSE